MSEGHHNNWTSNGTAKKRCGRCKEIKPLENFGIVKGVARSYCKACHAAANLNPDLRKEKRCCVCKQTKPVEDFGRKGVRFSSYCKICETEYSQKRRSILIETGEARIIDRENYWGRRKWIGLKSKYGITREQYEALEVEQAYRCAICNRHETDQYKGVTLHLTVDHDHDTGKVRGLLCRLCNIALGRFREDIPSLENAIKYLKKHGK